MCACVFVFSFFSITDRLAHGRQNDESAMKDRCEFINVLDAIAPRIDGWMDEWIDVRKINATQPMDVLHVIVCGTVRKTEGHNSQRNGMSNIAMAHN